MGKRARNASKEKSLRTWIGTKGFASGKATIWPRTDGCGVQLEITDGGEGICLDFSWGEYDVNKTREEALKILAQLQSLVTFIEGALTDGQTEKVAAPTRTSRAKGLLKEKAKE